MSVKTVQCCQCGSPLQLPESGSESGLLQCQHCSALLEVQQLEHGHVTRLRADVQALQEATAKHEAALRKLELERDLAELDREWKERWGDRKPGSLGAGVGVCLVLLVMVALPILLWGWSVRAPFTRAESNQMAEERAQDTSQVFEHVYRNVPHYPKTVPRVFPTIPWRPNWPARIGSVVLVGVLGGIAYVVSLYAELCESAASEYRSRRLGLIERANIKLPD